MAEDNFKPRLGIFWRADDPDKTRPGTLTRGAGKWELTLHGGLNRRHSGADGLELEEPTVIFGTAGERAYTLRHAYWRGGTSAYLADHDPGESDRTQRWIGYELIEDLHLPADARVTTVLFELGGTR